MPSLAPFLLPNNRKGLLIGDGTLTDALLSDGSSCPITNSFPGRLAEDTALNFDITRAAQDEYSCESYSKAREASQRLFFKQETEKVEVFTKGVDQKFVREDEELRKMNLASLPQLRTLFLKDGTITAGNSAKYADGACGIVCVNEQRARKIGVKPLARVLAWAHFETDPRRFIEATGQVVDIAVKKAGISLDGVDLFEIHEDFSLSVLVFLKMKGISREKVNVNGGALALGDPVGMSGARIVATLVYALRERNKSIGVAAVSHPGGGASAVVVEVV
jgi:acetyl-CoA C-acetyltransferase